MLPEPVNVYTRYPARLTVLTVGEPVVDVAAGKLIAIMQPRNFL